MFLNFLFVRKVNDYVFCGISGKVYTSGVTVQLLNYDKHQEKVWMHFIVQCLSIWDFQGRREVREGDWEGGHELKYLFSGCFKFSSFYCNFFFLSFLLFIVSLCFLIRFVHGYMGLKTFWLAD